MPEHLLQWHKIGMYLTRLHLNWPAKFFNWMTSVTFEWFQVINNKYTFYDGFQSVHLYKSDHYQLPAMNHLKQNFQSVELHSKLKIIVASTIMSNISITISDTMAISFPVLMDYCTSLNINLWHLTLMTFFITLGLFH